MQSGTRPTPPDRRDYDLLRTRKLGGVTTFPESYDVDQGLWMPNQNEACLECIPSYHQQLTGCGNFMCSDLCGDEDGKIVSPDVLDAITHASARGGADMREYLKAATTAIPGHPDYFTIRSSWKIDWFDAVRLAMLSASAEKRGVAIGSPYWLRFGAVGADGIYAVPDFDLSFASWHAWAVKGWKTINGTTYLICKMWQGASYGDHGFTYMSREIFNATMSVRGSGAFVIDKLLPGEKVQTVGISAYVADIVAYIRSLL